MSLMVDVQFFIYSYDKDRVRRTEGGHDRIGDFVDFMVFFSFFTFFLFLCLFCFVFS